MRNDPRIARLITLIGADLRPPADAALIAQFPLAHSALLTWRGGRLLDGLIPCPHEQALATNPMRSSPRPVFWRCLHYGHLRVSSDGGLKGLLSGP